MPVWLLAFRSSSSMTSAEQQPETYVGLEWLRACL